jgi:hypothetical protein
VWAPLGSIYGKEISVVRNRYNASSFFSSPSPTTNGQLGALYNSNPDLQAFFHIGYGAVDAGVDPVAVTYCIEIEYDTVWTGRQQVTSS